MTERLPVVLIPKERFISFVRDDVIYFGGWRDLALAFTLSTQGMSYQEGLAGTQPLIAVAPLGARAAPAVFIACVLALVLITSAASRQRVVSAPRITARLAWVSSRH